MVEDINIKPKAAIQLTEEQKKLLQGRSDTMIGITELMMQDQTKDLEQWQRELVECSFVTILAAMTLLNSGYTVEHGADALRNCMQKFIDEHTSKATDDIN